MTEPATPPMNISAEWVKFVETMQRVIAQRAHGAPVVMMVPQLVGDQSGFVNLIKYNMQPFYYPMLIVHLVDAFAREAPHVKEAQRIKALCDKLLGTIDTADVTRGRN